MPLRSVVRIDIALQRAVSCKGIIWTGAFMDNIITCMRSASLFMRRPRCRPVIRGHGPLSNACINSMQSISHQIFSAICQAILNAAQQVSSKCTGLSL